MATYALRPGAIELPLSCAQAVDPDNVGLEYWLSGCPPNDDRAKFSKQRTDCYQLVLRSLDSFEEKASRAQTPAEDLDTIRNHAYTLAFSSDDEMFHSTLYDWLIERGLADELLAVCALTLAELFNADKLQVATPIPRGSS